MRGKGEGAIYRVPKDKSQKLQYWTCSIELPPGPLGERRRKVVRRKNKSELLAVMGKLRDDLAALGDLPTNSLTVEAWMNHWVDKIASQEVRPNTLDGYRRTVTNHIIPAIGKVKLDKVTTDHVRRVHTAVIDKGNSSTTALLAHRTMSVAFKVAQREGKMPRNPAALVAAPKKAATKLEALTLDEAVKVLEHNADRPDGALWATYLLTGGRRGEMLGLEVDRVGDVLDLSWQMQRLKLTADEGKPDVPPDYEYRHITGGLYLTRPKSSSGWRIIPLIDPLRTILQRHIEQMEPNPHGLLFLRNGAPYGPDLASTDWRDMLTAAGITKDVRLHDARHTTVDLLYAAGVPDDLIQEIVGHSTRQQTQAYKSKRNQDRLTAAMQQLSALISGAGSAKGIAA